MGDDGSGQEAGSAESQPAEEMTGGSPGTRSQHGKDSEQGNVESEKSMVSSSASLEELATALQCHVEEAARHQRELARIAGQSADRLAGVGRFAEREFRTQSEHWTQRLLRQTSILPVIALLFSVLTWVVAERASNAADQRDARTQLSAVIAELSSLQEVQLRFQQSVLATSADPDDPSTRSQALQAAGSYRIERTRVLVSTARDILDRHTSIRQPSDGLVIGHALVQTNEYAGALAELAYAEENASDYSTFVTAARDAGGAAILLGDIAEASVHYEQALMAGERFSDVPSVTVRFNQVVTHLRWARAVEFLGDCDSADGQFEQALSILEQMPSNELTLAVSSVATETASYSCPENSEEFSRRISDLFPSLG